ncbi:MAG: terminase [Acidovorax sp.]|uniref:terminase n=1 Tax=Acidovorax sp. TaxID=1872122 RepID=UPI00261730FD|nr:terminase [Acidovorax sp.]MDH4466164.1 terminase [Acidovorax sp.]
MANINNIHKRLNTLESSVVAAATGDMRQRIVQARSSSARPTHSYDELRALAAGVDLSARIARGLLRIGHYTTGNARSPVPSIDPEKALPMLAGRLYDKPLDFVLFAFDWSVDRSLRLVRLPDEYRVQYDSDHGPDLWACDLLDGIGQEVRARAFDGTRAVEAIRAAVSSGHGIGKSAITSWLVLWIMTTRPNARGVVTANTSAQLESKTWAEVGKWLKRSVFADWFDITSGKGAMRLTAKSFAESWRCDAQTCREENSESFAGLHAADSTPFYIFDEASAIPAKIWEVGEGGMTDGEPMWFAFGNPTRTGTRFHGCFHGQRHRWITRRVDSTSCQITNKTQIDQWAQDYGKDSDFFKVRVLGEFPSQSSLQFIGRDLVVDAATRDLPSARGEAIVIGCDIARFGDDSTVLYFRQGRDARTYPPIKLKGADTMQVASRIAEQANLYRQAGNRVVVAVDGGGVGGGVIDRLRAIGHEVEEVQFGSRALDPRRYAQRRSELWGLLKDWLKVGAIANDQELLDDLTGPEFGFTSTEQVQLERKADMKARGLSSPDIADALAITMAVVPPLPGEDALPRGRYNDRDRLAVLDYDPMAYLR